MQADKTQQTDIDIDRQILVYINEEVASEPVDLETDLLLTGAVDSIGVMRVTQWMEDSHGVDVDPIEVTVANFQTVERMSNFLKSKLKA